MPKYEITRTETVTVWGNDEEHATEVAIAEMQECPNGDYEVKQLTPQVNANLTVVKILLESFGITPVDVVTPHHLNIPRLDIGIHKIKNYEGNLVPCTRFSLYGVTGDDGENWNGEGWFLETCEGEEIASFTNLDSFDLAGSLAYQIGRAMFDLESRGRGE